MQIKGRSRAAICASKFAVAAIADRHVFQPAIHDEIDECRRSENAVREEIPADKVEPGADRSADDHHRESHLWIEVLTYVEVGSLADRAAIDGTILADGVGD